MELENNPESVQYILPSSQSPGIQRRKQEYDEW